METLSEHDGDLIEALSASTGREWFRSCLQCSSPASICGTAKRRAESAQESVHLK